MAVAEYSFPKLAAIAAVTLLTTACIRSGGSDFHARSTQQDFRERMSIAMDGGLTVAAVVDPDTGVMHGTILLGTSWSEVRSRFSGAGLTIERGRQSPPAEIEKMLNCIAANACAVEGLQKCEFVTMSHTTAQRCSKRV